MSVDPGAVRFHRQRILPGFGDAAQRRLAAAHVVVMGAGGLGSTILPALAAAGVGTLTIVDDDVVSESNLHRQTLYGPADVGRPKVEAAAEALRHIAPEVAVIPVVRRFEPGNAAELLQDADLLVDGTDNIAARYTANDAAAARGIPLVWGSALKFSGQVGVAWDARGVDYRDLFPAPPDDEGETCEIAGVLPTVPAVTGALMASEAIKVVAGVGEPLLGRVAVYDALSGTTREIPYRRDPSAPRPATGPVPPRAAAAAPVPTVTPAELAQTLSAGEPPLLLDVREPFEAEIATLPDAVLIPLGELPDRLDELPGRDTPVVVYCHRGVRSARALGILQDAGFSDVRHLSGGIDRWSLDVDPEVTRY